MFSRDQDERKGNLIQDILDQIDGDHSMNHSKHAESPCENTYNVEHKLVDLVAGDDTNRIGRILKKLERDSDASLSDEFSDVEDPIHEDSLITDLFYTARNVSYYI